MKIEPFCHFFKVCTYYLLIVIMPISVLAAAPEMSWEKTYRGIDYTNEFAAGGIQSRDGGYLSVGATGNCFPDVVCRDLYLVKTDRFGALEWEKIIGGGDHDHGADLIETAKGDIIVAGLTKSSGAGESDAWIIRMDADGEILWEQTFGGTGADEGTAILGTTDGHILVLGRITIPGTSQTDMWLMKLDGEGNLQWEQTYGDATNDGGSELIATSDGGYALFGYHNKDGWIIKVDGSGNIQWDKLFNYGNTPNTNCGIADGRQTADGGYMLAGSAYDMGATITQATDVWLIKLDVAGEIEWDRLYHDDGYESATELQITETGGYFVVADGNLDMWAFETDADGNLIWDSNYKYIDEATYSGFGILTADGGYLLGATGDGLMNRKELCLVKLGGTDGSGTLFQAAGEDFSGIDFGVYDVAFGDLDRDGDLDLALAGINGSAAAKIYLNDGSGHFSDSGQALGGFNAINLLLEDLDRDADLDLVVAGRDNLVVYLNDGQALFSAHEAHTDLGYHYFLTAGDLDNDGDVDVYAVAENNSYAKALLNQGDGHFEEGGYSPNLYCHEPDLGDVDADGDLDVAVAENWRPTQIRFNDGNMGFDSFVVLSGSYATQGGVYLVDADSDGDLDLFEANQSGAASYLFLNDGSGEFSDSGQSLGPVTIDRIAIGDVDTNGALDLVATSSTGPGGPVYLNDGNGLFYTNNDNDFWGNTIALGDVDKDGDLDAVGQTQSGEIDIFSNNRAGIMANTAPLPPSGLQVSRNGDQLTFCWAAGSDAETPTTALTYNLRVGTTASGNDVLSSMIPAGPGNVGQHLCWTLEGLTGSEYFGSVQTIDGGYGSSAWSPVCVYTEEAVDVIIYFFHDDTVFDAPAPNNNSFTKFKSILENAGLTVSVRNLADVPVSAAEINDRKGVVFLPLWYVDRELSDEELDAIEAYMMGGGKVFVANTLGWDRMNSYTTWFSFHERLGFTHDSGGAAEMAVTDFEPHLLTRNVNALTVAHNGYMFENAATTILAVAPNNHNVLGLARKGAGEAAWWASADTFLDGNIVTNAYQASIEDGDNRIFTENIAKWFLDEPAITGSLSINSGETLCNNVAVHLTLLADNAAWMSLSNDNQTYSSWQVYSAIKAWTLSDGDGEKVVYVKYKDAVGNEVISSDTIVLDTVGPNAVIQINGGDIYTTSRVVSISISSADAVSMCFSTDGQTFTDWEAYASSKQWELPDGDGQKTVYVKVRDSAGNVSISSYQILLDTTPPGIPILVELSTTNDNEPLLDWEVVDTTRYYELEYGLNDDLASAERVIEIEPSEYTVPTPLTDGTWYWRVRAIDGHGNVGDWSCIDAFIVDTADNCETIISTPVLLSPVNEANNVSLEPTLTTSAFNDQGNCSGHWKTHWKINDQADDFEGATTFNYISIDHSQNESGNADQTKGSLTSLEVPSLILEAGTTYYWKVRYHGDHGNKSDWSDVYSFTTQDDAADQNSNGIPDDSEVDDDTDLNNDGIPDNEQVGVIASVTTAKGNKKIGIDIGECEIVKVQVLDEADISDDSGKPDQMPFGLVGYKFKTNYFGETVTVKIHLSEPAPENARWVMYDKIDGWLDYSGYVSFNDSRDEVAVELKDGGYGDEDHTENKWIIDPSGAGVYTDDGENSDDSTTCFIGTLNECLP